MAIADITKPMALDETLQETNTALGLLGKDATLQSIVTALATIGLNTVGNLASLTTEQKTSLVAAINEINAGKISTSVKGSANGVAELDANGRVPSSQLPSYVDDTVEGYLYNGVFYSDSAHEHPITGETGKIYVELVSNKTYRWSGSAYVEISESLALGETSSTAYAGNKGKANADNISAIQGLIPSSATTSNKLATASDIPVITGKADKVSGATNGNLAGLDVNGNLTDSGIASSTLEAITNVYGSKNLLPFNINTIKSLNTSGTWSGNSYSYHNIIVTLNEDGSVTMNGTSDTTFNFVLADLSSDYINKVAGMLFSCGSTLPEGLFLILYRSGKVIEATAQGVVIESEIGACYEYIYITAGNNYSNVTIYPMIRDARISDSVYAPYAMTNRELTEKVGKLHAIQLTSTTDAYGQFTIYDSNFLNKVVAVFVVNVENAFAVRSLNNALRIYAGSNSSTTDDPIKMLINTEVTLNILYYEF